MTATGERAGTGLLSALAIAYGQIGVHDRAARLADAAAHVGRPLTSTKELGVEEASWLRRHLRRCTPDTCRFTTAVRLQPAAPSEAAQEDCAHPSQTFDRDAPGGMHVCLSCGAIVPAGAPEQQATDVTWWHAYGQVVDLSAVVPGDGPGELSPCWQLIVIGPASKGPEVAERLTMHGTGGTEVPYLASWDHEPSDDEKDSVTPEAYRDEVSA